MAVSPTDPGPPDDEVPQANQRAKASYAQTLQVSKSSEQENNMRNIAKNANSFHLHPMEGKPKFLQFYQELYKLVGTNKFSLVPLANGAYEVTIPNAITRNQVKSLANPTVTFAGKRFKLLTFDNDLQEYILRQVPSYVPRSLLLQELQVAFGKQCIIESLKPMRRRIPLEDGQFTYTYSGDYVITVSNPPVRVPSALHYGSSYFRISRKNACFYCGNPTHMKKDCPEYSKRDVDSSERKHTLHKTPMEPSTIEQPAKKYISDTSGKVLTRDSAHIIPVNNNNNNNAYVDPPAQSKKSTTSRISKERSSLEEVPPRTIQYATRLDYEDSKTTETALRDYHGKNYEEYVKKLTEIGKSQGKTPVFGEDGRLLDPDDESMGESSEGEWSGGDPAAPNHD